MVQHLPKFMTALSFSALLALPVLAGTSEVSKTASVPTFPKEGLVARWTFDTAEAGNLPDLSGHGHDGRLHGSVTQATGRRGQALAFSEKGGLVQVPHNATFALPGQSYTIALWLKGKRNGAYQTVLQKGREAGAWAGLWIAPNGALVYGSKGGNISGPSVTEKWQCVVLVQSAETKTRTLYVDGIAVAQGAAQPFESTEALTIGGRPNPAHPESFIGLIDDAAVYGRALSLEEICSLSGTSASKVRFLTPPEAKLSVQNIHGIRLSPSKGNDVLPDGAYTYTLTLKDGSPYTNTFSVNGQPLVIDHATLKKHTVTFQTLKGAEVLLMDRDGVVASEGNCCYALFPGEYRYIITKKGYRPIRASLQVNEEDVVINARQMQISRATETGYVVSAEEMANRITGGWIGQMAGVTWGAPTEFRYLRRRVPDAKVPQWKPEMINGTLAQDDLYVEIPFLQCFEAHGVNVRWHLLGEAFRKTTFRLWAANAQARANLNGRACAVDYDVKAYPNANIAPLSGHYKNNPHADDIDWQIEADSSGMIGFGQPALAQEIAWRVGHVMNYGDGVYGGVFVATMYAAAATAETWEQVIDAGLQAIPVGTKFREMMQKVVEHYESDPDKTTWQDCWQMLEAYPPTHKDKGAPDRPYNIDAKLNSAYILIGLLYGGQDLETTMRISMQCGQDSDCNPSSAGGILGMYLGKDNLPAKWYSALKWKESFEGYAAYSPARCIEMTIASAKEALLMSGGKVDQAGSWHIPYNPSKPLIREQWPDQENLIPKLTAKAERDPDDPSGRTWRFTASATDQDGTIKEYQWFFGDLTFASGAKQLHRYPSPGTYYAVCYTTDDVGNTAYIEIPISVTDTPQK